MIMQRTTAVLPGNFLESNKSNRLKMLLVLSALTAFNTVSIDMYLPAFPQMARDLSVPIGIIQLSVPAYLVGSAAGQLFYGPVSDRWGRKVPLIFGLLLYILATVGCALIGSGHALLFWRILMALGGGASIVISRAIVRDFYSGSEAARMLSLLILVMGVSPILAPLVGSQFLLVTGWRGIFVFLSLFGLFALYGTLAWLPESLPAERRQARRFGEMLSIYGQLMKTRRYLCYALALGAVAGNSFAYIAGAPQFFIELHGVSPQAFGLLFGINACGLIGASQINRKLLRHYSMQRILQVAFVISSLTGVLLTLSILTGLGGYLAQAILIFACFSSAGVLFPNIMALALEPYAVSAGSASALLGTVQYGLGALGGVFVGLFHDTTGLPMALVMAISAVIGNLLFLAAKEK